jgi:carbonic anhydrase
MKRLKEGLRSYRDNVFPAQKELLERLAREGQKPHTVVVACSDSRIKVSQWTRADPGEFFIVRNAGNIVPPPGCVSGVGASLEYAVKCLPIRHVIVAGHSHCGAVSALFDPILLESLPETRRWLEHAREARPRAEERCGPGEQAQHIREAVAQNVVLQLDHLRAYPFIREGVEAGRLTLYGWVLDFETGSTWELDENSGEWSLVV